MNRAIEEQQALEEVQEGEEEEEEELLSVIQINLFFSNDGLLWLAVTVPKLNPPLHLLLLRLRPPVHA